jgi:hypothetical protein
VDEEHHDNEGQFVCEWCGLVIEGIDKSDVQYWHYDDRIGCHEICEQCYHGVKWDMGKPVIVNQGLMKWVLKTNQK